MVALALDCGRLEELNCGRLVSVHVRQRHDHAILQNECANTFADVPDIGVQVRATMVHAAR